MAFRSFWPLPVHCSVLDFWSAADGGPQTHLPLDSRGGLTPTDCPRPYFSRLKRCWLSQNRVVERQHEALSRGVYKRCTGGDQNCISCQQWCCCCYISLHCFSCCSLQHYAREPKGGHIQPLSVHKRDYSCWLRENPGSRRMLPLAQVFNWSALALEGLALILFIRGVFVAARAFEILNPTDVRCHLYILCSVSVIHQGFSNTRK
jgi:hypothetical protein